MTCRRSTRRSTSALPSLKPSSRPWSKPSLCGCLGHLVDAGLGLDLEGLDLGLGLARGPSRRPFRLAPDLLGLVGLALDLLEGRGLGLATMSSASARAAAIIASFSRSHSALKSSASRRRSSAVGPAYSTRGRGLLELLDGLRRRPGPWRTYALVRWHGFLGPEYGLGHAPTFLLDKLVAFAAGDDDLAGLLEVADDGDDLLLGFLDVLDADGAHVLHVFLEHACAARLDMFLKIFSWTSVSTPLRALASSWPSTSRRTFWMERSSSRTMSSNTNIFFLISSASSGLSSSRASMMPFSEVRSTRLRISTMESTPPAVVKSSLDRVESFFSRTRSTSRRTSGDVRSIVAMRLATSDCTSWGSFCRM